MGEFSRQWLLPGVDLKVVGVLERGWRSVPEGAVRPGVDEPVDPVQGAELEVIDAASESFVAHCLEFELKAPSCTPGSLASARGGSSVGAALTSVDAAQSARPLDADPAGLVR